MDIRKLIMAAVFSILLLIAPSYLSAQHDSVVVEWTYRIPAKSVYRGKAIKLEPAHDGGVYVVLRIESDTKLPDWDYPFYNQSLTDALIFRLSNTGNLLWVRQLSGKQSEVVHQVEADSKGNLIVLLASSSPVISFSDEVEIRSTSYHSTQLFVVKFSPDGTPLWINQLGNDGRQVGNSLILDHLDNIYLSGHFGKSKKEMMASNDFVVPPVTVGNPYHSYLLKYDTAGHLLWGKVVEREDCFLSKSFGEKIYMVSRESREVPEYSSTSGKKARALYVDAYSLNGDSIWSSKLSSNASGNFDGITVCSDSSLLVYSRKYTCKSMTIDSSILSLDGYEVNNVEDKGTKDLLFKLTKEGKLQCITGLPFNVNDIEQVDGEHIKAVGGFWPDKYTSKIGSLTDIPKERIPCPYPILTNLSSKLALGYTQLYTTCFTPNFAFSADDYFFLGSYLESNYFPLKISNEYSLEKESSSNEFFIMKGKFH